MGISLRKYTECSAKNKRSYQLRTGQMKLPVRKIEPVQYVDSKFKCEKKLPSYPIVGVIYNHRGKIVECIETKYLECDLCLLKNDPLGCNFVRCNIISRADNKNIKIIPYNA